jgi:hypothetical protein
MAQLSWGGVSKLSLSIMLYSCASRAFGGSLICLEDQGAAQDYRQLQGTADKK